MSSTEALQPEKDAVLYLVDGSESMKSNGTFSKVIESIVSSIRLIHRQGDRHFDTGVVLFNCVTNNMRTNTRSKFPDVEVAMRVSKPEVQDLKELAQLAELSSANDADSIKPVTTSETSLVNALQQVKLELAALNLQSFRRLVIISDNDNPGNLPVIQRLAHDLVEMNVLVVPIFLAHPESPFDPTKFWSQIVYLPPSLSMASRNSNLNVSLQPYNIDHLETNLAALVLSKAERKPTAFRGTLVLESLALGITAYRIVSRSSPRRPHYVTREDGVIKPLGTSTSYVDQKSRQLVDTSSIERMFVLSNHDHLPISQEDADTLHELRPASSQASIVINGFVSVDDLPATQGVVRSSLLIVPSNFILENSKKAFASLRRSMVRKHCVAQVTYYSKNSRKTPVNGCLYAFDPSPVLSDRQIRLQPAPQSGMYFVELPFVDDLRHHQYSPPNGHNVESNLALDDQLTKLVHKFRLLRGFDPVQFPSPALVQSSIMLEAIALGIELPSKDLVDTTRPNYNKIERNASNLAADIRAILDQLETSSGASEPKKIKPMALNEFSEAHKIGRLHLFTVPELRWALRELNMLTTGLKPELVDRLAAYLG